MLHRQRLLWGSLCAALGQSTIVIARALFCSPNKLFLQIKNEKSSSSHSSFLRYSSSGGRGRGCTWTVGAERGCTPVGAGAAGGRF